MSLTHMIYPNCIMCENLYLSVLYYYKDQEMYQIHGILRTYQLRSNSSNDL